MEHSTGTAGNGQQAYVRVIDHIKQEIRLGHLTIGSRLPAERTLAEQLNVSRNSVREALHILEVMGITVSTQGAGHFISGNFETSLAETMSMLFLLKKLSFEQVSQLRYALEKQAFALAMEKATPEDLEELQTINTRMEQDISEEENVMLDKQLHYTLARISDNLLIVEILHALSDVMYRFITDLRQDIMADDERREMLAASHRRLVECMCSKDLEGGYTAIDMHFSLIDSQLNVRPRSD